MLLNAMLDQLLHLDDHGIGIPCVEHRVVRRLDGIAGLGMHRAGDLVDIVAQAGQLRPQLVKLRRQCTGYRLEKHSLPRVAADGESRRFCVSGNLIELVFIDADVDDPRAVVLNFGVNHLLVVLHALREQRADSSSAGVVDDRHAGFAGTNPVCRGLGNFACHAVRWLNGRNPQRAAFGMEIEDLYAQMRCSQKLRRELRLTHSRKRPPSCGRLELDQTIEADDAVNIVPLAEQSVTHQIFERTFHSCYIASGHVCDHRHIIGNAICNEKCAASVRFRCNVDQVQVQVYDSRAVLLTAQNTDLVAVEEANRQANLNRFAAVLHVRGIICSGVLLHFRDYRVVRSILFDGFVLQFFVLYVRPEPVPAPFS